MTKFNNLDSEIQTLDEQRQMRNLANAIELADSFSLLFVRCNQRPRQQEIIEELKARLTDLNIKIIFLDHQIEHLLDELQTRLGDEKPDAIFVYGLESSFPKADEAANSPFVVTLNHSRNSFKKILDCPLVLFLPEYALSAIYHGATDFYSIRSGVYLFSAKAEETEQLITTHISQGYWESQGLLFEERQSKIKTIENLLTEYKSLPNLQRDFVKEFIATDKLADLYYISGEYDKAENLYQKSAKYFRESQNDFLLAQALNGLATIYDAQKKPDKAIKLYKEVLEKAEKTIGSQHPSYASYLINFAKSYKSQNKYNEAVKLLKEAAGIYKKTLGIKNPNYAGLLNNLAAILEEQGRYDEAETLFREAIGIVKGTFGDKHISYATGLSNLANLYYDQKKYREALHLVKEAYQICLKILGKKHFQTQDFKKGLDMCQTKIKEQLSLIVPYKK